MSLTPLVIFRSVENITPRWLERQGIRALVLDVDNTLTHDGSQVLDASVAAWLAQIQQAGIRLLIVSNNTDGRVRPFARRIGLGYVPMALKPHTRGLRIAQQTLGLSREEMAMVGDQIFTDLAAAQRFGIRCLLVEPRGRDINPFVTLKRLFEKPLIARYYRRGGTLL